MKWFHRRAKYDAGEFLQQLKEWDARQPQTAEQARRLKEADVWG